MKRFYVQFLGGRIVKESGPLAFITYDDEHHRIALINMPLKNKDAGTAGLAHFAFTFDSLPDLCKAYKQRKALGIEPGWCVVRQSAWNGMVYSNCYRTMGQRRRCTTEIRTGI